MNEETVGYSFDYFKNQWAHGENVNEREINFFSTGNQFYVALLDEDGTIVKFGDTIQEHSYHWEPQY